MKHLVNKIVEFPTYQAPGTLLPVNLVTKGKVRSIFSYPDGKGGNYAELTLVTPEGVKPIRVPDVQSIKEIEDKAFEELIVAYQIKNLSDYLQHSHTTGSDPEVFVTDKEGKIIPAFLFLGDKKKPSYNDRPIYESYKRGIYWDGFQAEFEVRQDTCLQSVWHSIRVGLQGVYDNAIKFNKNAQLSVATNIDIPYELIKDAKEEHVQFGCMPSLNAYGMEGTKANGRDVLFRSCGGHIHLGIGKLPEDELIRGVKAMDAILGVACVSLFAKFDEPRRRQLYGLAGEYRLPPHGLEYRALSNAWLSHPLMYHIVFDLARKALVFGRNEYMHLWKTSEEDTINCINNCDVDMARRIMTDNKATLLKIINGAYKNPEMAEAAYKIFFEGMESAVENPADIIGNWNLTKDNYSDGNTKLFHELRYVYKTILAGGKVN